MTNHPFHRHSGGKRHGSCIYVDLVPWCVQSLQTPPCSHWWKITLYLVIQAFILLFLDINIQQNVAFTLIDTSTHILIDLCSLDHCKAHELYIIQSNGEGITHKLWAFFSLFFWEEHYLYQIISTLKFQDKSKINVGENPFLKATLKKVAFLESRSQLSLDSQMSPTF